MPTFDVANKLDMQLVENAINNVNRIISQRYDFKGVEVLVELNKKDKTLKIEVPDDMKLKHVQDIVAGALIDQQVSSKVVDWGKREDASLGAIRLKCKLREGIEKDIAKDIVKRIKDSGLKVKTQIQGDQVRVEGKQIDDLQQVIALLKEANLAVPLQFLNMKK
jgi:cyclic-di-GMP-binding protein